MSKVLSAVGSGGLATVTMTGVANKSIRLMGALGTSGTSAATSATVLPVITFTQVRADDGTTFTATVGSAEGGAATNQTRSVVWLPRREHHLDVVQGLSCVAVYQSAIAAATPQLVVWYDAW